jgi:hypothetical protein
MYCLGLEIHNKVSRYALSRFSFIFISANMTDNHSRVDAVTVDIRHHENITPFSQQNGVRMDAHKDVPMRQGVW